MPKVTMYHNPQCSKCRTTLGLLQEKNVPVEIIEYQKTPPDAEALKTICARLGVHPLEIIRTGERLFLDLGLSKDDDRSEEEWIKIMVENPVLIQRPIMLYENKAVIGRPPERVLDIL